ncbi:MAG: hypothetical protein FKY71_18655 [Spiribacter salinus]|uniref:Uncharacterized protein n=1 Tax=Spiribacter salinus TaxID=1335746 RepID=A0A540V9W6_9GAMM|nr:MAG: hypothetical protein FKY71_18655 [Spiribacter salinus]
MTKIAMALKAAIDLKGMNIIEATRVANAVHDKLQDVTAAYAAERGINHREVVMAEVTIATKHGCFDTPDSDERYWEEQLIEAGLGWDEIAEVEHDRELEKQSRQNELVNRKDATAEDEGRVSTALHEFRQLAELDAKDIEYAEGSYAQVAFMDMNWPTDDPMWPEFTGRLERAWTASIEWADEGPAKQELITKTERRDEVVQDFHCRPYLTRWVLNHLTRRAWRDIHWLGIKRKEFADRIDKIVQEKYLNERYQVPVGQNRRRDEGADNDRVINLLYREVSEADTKANHHQMLATEHTFAGMNGASVTAQKHIDVYEEEGEHEQADAELRFWGACIDEIDDILPGLKRLYEKLRAMEKETALLWEMFAKGGRPSEPPIYWNRALTDAQLEANPGSRNYYLTEEEAVAALHREIKEQKVKMRKEDGDALTRAMALLGHNHGIDV